MKFIALILSIYILTLNLVPCEDSVVIDNKTQTEISQPAGDDHQHQDSDFCSPFCICQCCHINVIQYQFTDTKLEINNISTQDFFYLSGTEKDFATSILQPPQS